jgi:hypothetical protein
MKNEFIPYEQALALKELGFDEPCLAGYNFKDRRTGQFTYPSAKEPNTTSEARVYYKDKKIVGTPLYQQAFRFFREKYGLYHSIGLDNSLEDDVNCDYQIINHSQSISESETDFKTYEKAELACLLELINICKKK